MAENSTAATIGKFGLGLGAGFGLYWLIRNLGFGAGGGFGGERGEGTGAPTPGPSPEISAPPSIPRDEVPLLLVASHPKGATDFGKLPDPTSRARHDVVLHRLDLGTEDMALDEMYRRMGAMLRSGNVPAMSLDEAIARIKAGGRDDVRLITPGSIRQGSWDDVLDALMAAGINHWKVWKDLYQPHEKPYPGYVWRSPHWELYGPVSAVDNPNKAGHYLVTNRGTAYWNLTQAKDGKEAPRVSGWGRGHYGANRSVGRGYYR